MTFNRCVCHHNLISNRNNLKLRVNRRNNSQHDEGCCVYLHAAKSLTSFTLACSNKVFTWVWHGEGKGPDLPTLTLSEDSHKEPDEFSTGHKLLHLGKLRRPTALLFKVSLLTVFSEQKRARNLIASLLLSQSKHESFRIFPFIHDSITQSVVS